MKTIAITQRLILNPESKVIQEALDIRWGKLFQKLNWIPYILTSTYPIEKQIKNINIDGIIFTGGNDLVSVSDSTLSIIRDDFEKKCLEFALKNKIKILGICRGMQLINEYFGGTLKIIDNHIAKRHQIISQILNEHTNVNSYHKFAINKLGQNLKVIASSKDNSIEAICHKDFNIMAIMWHPEREKPFKKEDLFLLKKFFK